MGCSSRQQKTEVMMFNREQFSFENDGRHHPLLSARGLVSKETVVRETQNFGFIN